MVLCLLALSFALEAKTAWYGPQGFASDVRAAKALPADVPQVILHGISGANTLAGLASVALLLTLAASFLRAEVALKQIVVHRRIPVESTGSFSPHSFFRPPPVQ
jgi:hypothetical protein